MGTPGYIAPEQIVDPTRADIRADIYSLGCTLYFLLAGQSPFADITSREILLSPQKRLPRPIHELRKYLPAGLIAVINKMMAQDPAQRYATPAQVMKALASFARPAPASTAETPIASKPPVSQEQAPPPDPNSFPAQCPFCKARYRLPNKAVGGSIEIVFDLPISVWKIFVEANVAFGNCTTSKKSGERR